MGKDPRVKQPEDMATDKASVELIRKAQSDNVSTCFTRVEEQKGHCKFGLNGVCCRICNMGPCRVTPKSPRGVCGANADTIVARNYLREVAGGCAAHSDHGRHLVLLLKKVAQGKSTEYVIKDEAALRRAARDYRLPCAQDENTDKMTLANALADAMLDEFTSQETPLKTPELAPLQRQGAWRNADLLPKGVDRMIVECMHRSHIGVDHDYKNILMHGFRTSLADGWGGSRIATIVSDILFGTPTPVRTAANLGVLGENTINILVHGHEPALSEMLAYAVRDEEVKQKAIDAGAEGITLAGICCTANEVLMRHGIPPAGNFLQQELAIVTGAVELMVTDIQCVMPSLPNVAASYHTHIISTSDLAKTIGATHKSFDATRAMECAKEIILQAVENYTHRDPAKVNIPNESSSLVAGFSVHAIKHMLGGSFRASFRPLNDAIIHGRIKGIAGIVGCNNANTKLDHYINTVTKKLVENDVLVIKTGCAALASAKAGMLTPESALKHAGDGLKEVCQAVGLPPVLHMGSCVDNSRILEAAAEIVAEGGLGNDISDVPAVGLAPEWMSEKAVSIGCYCVASGIDVIMGSPFRIRGSENVTNFLENEVQDLFGACFHTEVDPIKAAELVMQIINRKRKKLGIDRQAQRKLFDMKDRRALNV